MWSLYKPSIVLRLIKNNIQLFLLLLSNNCFVDFDLRCCTSRGSIVELSYSGSRQKVGGLITGFEKTVICHELNMDLELWNCKWMMAL